MARVFFLGEGAKKLALRLDHLEARSAGSILEI
jgi:hypothetical protein